MNSAVCRQALKCSRYAAAAGSVAVFMGLMTNDKNNNGNRVGNMTNRNGPNCSFHILTKTECYMSHYAEQEAMRRRYYEQEEERRFQQALEHHGKLLEEYREKWDYNKPSSRIPTTSWPKDIPTDEELPALMAELKYCQRNPTKNAYCQQVQFRIGAFYLLHTHDPPTMHKGLAMIKDLAEREHPDAMCLYGQCLNEGRAGLDPNPIQGVVWFRRCAELYDHPQALYEMGVAFYTGEGVMEDEVQAVDYFRLASDLGHPSASYLLGDCLLDGFGVERDRAEALERLLEAANRGHRGARSRVLAVLEHKDQDFGIFTDGSRQTLALTLPQMEESQIRLERRCTIGGAIPERKFTVGGVRPAAGIARRLTNVQDSRNG